MKSTSAKQLYAYWQALRDDRPAPERREIEPAAIKSLLGDVFILEHVGGVDFSFRLAGSALCSTYCRELKGRSFRRYWQDKDHDALDTLLLAIREEAAVAVLGYEGVNARGLSAPFEMLLLPLRYGGLDYPRILGVSVPVDTPYWFGLHPVEHHVLTSLRLVWPDEQPAFMRQVVNACGTFSGDGMDGAGLDRAVDEQAMHASDRQLYADSRADLRRRAFRVIAGGRE